MGPAGVKELHEREKAGCSDGWGGTGPSWVVACGEGAEEGLPPNPFPVLLSSPALTVLLKDPVTAVRVKVAETLGRLVRIA